MRKILPILLLVLGFCFGIHLPIAQSQTTLSVSPSRYTNVVPGVLYIQLKMKRGIDFGHLSPIHTGNQELDQFFAKIGVNDIYPFDSSAKSYSVACRHGIDRMYVINFPEEGTSPATLLSEALKLDAIEAASPRYIFEKCYVPNDEDVPFQYALDNSHMHVLDAWGITKGNPNFIIADCDEGVNYTHEDLAANILKLGNNFGYDAVGSNGSPGHLHPDNDPMPGPGQSHGTMTTGCFGAVTDNLKGGAGSAYNCKIMAIKIADDAGNLVGGYEGIQFAVEHGAKIINCSWRAISDPQALPYAQQYIDEALDSGALVVAAAGNDGLNNDNSTDSVVIPACLKGVLSVGSTDQDDSPSAFSDYGHSVLVYGPGANIFSTTLPNTNSYDYESGTSFSTPLIAGVAALVWAKNPTWAPKFVTRQLIETVDNVVRPSDRKHYWGRVNALTALTKQTVPGVGITDYKIDGVDKGGLNYTDKVYTIDVTFKNFMAQGSGIQAQLLPVDGYTNASGINGYTVQQGSATLGAMATAQQITSSFKFTRDGTDLGAGTQLPLYFAVSYGTATVEGDKYYDTLVVNVNITGDNIFSTKGVAEIHSNILQLGNTYPNPVSGDATIGFELEGRGYAHLSICDVLGRTINTLSDGIFDGGAHSIHFDARGIENGVYLYKLETADGAVMIKRMIVAH